MLNTELATELLNDLVKVNNDRIAGYQRAINETKELDIDLKATFEKMIVESEGYKQELISKLTAIGGDVEADGTTTAGKIYRAWMDVKATFSGSDRATILDSCEFGEDAAQRAYESALVSGAELDEEIRQLITEQQASLKIAHDLIKKYRDAQHAAK
ncbi:MAG: PA2169 family four-helix-bundle protein [Sphingobacteriales bacterium]|nr:MAG: PA2169 family four-helix-bundle protein [Sphingobacteriales bacterium]